MPRNNFSRAGSLIAAAVAAAGAGLVVSAAPAQAAGCQQWGFPGPVSIKRNTGETINFTADGANAGSPADWDHNQGSVEHGNISGGIGPDGAISLTYFESDGTSIPFTGQVDASGKASGMSPPEVPWHTLAPLTCVTKAALEPPTANFTNILGGLSVDITDHSGVASNCKYTSEIVNKNFSLPANGTTNIKIVPAVPLFTDRSYDIVCDNGTETHATTFF